jgi:hypothetical protein
MKPNLRRCISCRAIAPKTQFLRVVRKHSIGSIELNQGMGRSAYICPTVECIGLAQKKKRLDRALRSTISPDFYQQIWSYLQGDS